MVPADRPPEQGLEGVEAGVTGVGVEVPPEPMQTATPLTVPEDWPEGQGPGTLGTVVTPEGGVFAEVLPEV